MSRRARGGAVSVTWRSRVALVAAALIGLAVFCWPLVAPSGDVAAYSGRAPFVFALVLPVILALVLVELSSGAIDVKALAMLGVLTAIDAVLRPLSAGTAGIDLVFFLIILGARVFGAGFGFIMGAMVMLVSSLLIGGVGPWLPYQALCCAYVGLFAGVLPRRVRGAAEIAMLCGWGMVGAVLYGTLMDFAFWPYYAGTSGLGWDAEAGLGHNLHTFALFELATGMGWNVGRAVTTAVAIILVGPGVLRVLRRADRRAFFAEADEPAPGGESALTDAAPGTHRAVQAAEDCSASGD
ncbi:ECF transporter, predicted substrate-specific component UCP037395 [Propionibacterium ruminifibrarum]|uniref:ECF transporter, predicted substrate-specific component UCP037395 n=1 Tax=Propionibacterium ruminifibrarum TaxID=1962131 RepID=A0A375I527_9ACTN|nr:ECF transporter S component [Propionibacterium ruminifibrarum]SPF69296.1 ECF transporter, predicted substrate-specific component UCP037395 [Propionibacterium ruminifibrarum]